jgi:hypothetical protein
MRNGMNGFSRPTPEPVALWLHHPSEKKIKIKELEHLLRGKVGQLFRNRR